MTAAVVQPRADWIAIEGEYRAGKRSLRDIAAEHGISEGLIRKKAKAGGWLRDPEGAKRERVRAIMAGAGTQGGTLYAARTLEAEARQDAEDMGMLLEVARACARNLLAVAQVSDDPKEIKTITEAVKNAMDIIRRIRGLDDEDKRQVIAPVQIVQMVPLDPLPIAERVDDGNDE